MKALKVNVTKKDVHGKTTKEEVVMKIGEKVTIGYDISFDTPEALLQIGAKLKFGCVVDAEVIEVADEPAKVV